MRGRWAAGWRKRRELFLSSDSGRIESEPGGEKGIKKPEARLSGCLHCEPPASPAVSPSSRQGPRGPPTLPPVRHLYGRSKGRGAWPLASSLLQGTQCSRPVPDPRWEGGGPHSHTPRAPQSTLSATTKPGRLSGASTEQTDLLHSANSCIANSQSLPRTAGLGWTGGTQMPSRGFPEGRLDSAPPPELLHAAGSLGGCSLEPPGPLQPPQLALLSECLQAQL